MKVQLNADVGPVVGPSFPAPAFAIGSLTMQPGWGHTVAIRSGSLIPKLHSLQRYDHQASPAGTATGAALSVGCFVCGCFGGCGEVVAAGCCVFGVVGTYPGGHLHTWRRCPFFSHLSQTFSFQMHSALVRPVAPQHLHTVSLPAGVFERHILCR